MNRKRAVAQIAAVLALTVSAVTVAQAWATYPGSANGRLAFGITLGGNTDVYSVMPDGGALHRLTDDPAADICPAYSADGKWIAWCGPGGIWLMKQNGTQKRQLTSFGVFPDISPDGARIVFNGAPPGSTNVDLYVVDVEGSGVTRLTTDPGLDRFGAWSPDGHKVVFESTRSGVNQVWVINADGSDQTQLTFDAAPKDQVPDWSPDGSRIVYVARTPLGGDIWVIDADGTDPRALTSGPPDQLGAAWSPDGSQIAYLNFTTRTVEVMNADGTDPHPVHPLGVQFVPGWQPRGTGPDDGTDE